MNRKNKPDIFQKSVAMIFRRALSLRYKIIISGKSLLWSDCPKLFLPNHQSLVDPIIIISEIFKYQKVSPAVSATYFKNKLFRFILKQINAIPVTDLERTGNRDTNVLEKMLDDILFALSSGRNALIYPSGQLSQQQEEKIKNKQGVYRLIPLLPSEVKIIGIRVNGLWGSSWSRAATGKTPDFMHIFWKSVLFLVKHGIFFSPRRKVFLELSDITTMVKKNAATLNRYSFNSKLENFFNKNSKKILVNNQTHKTSQYK